MATGRKVYRPQIGPQTDLLSTRAQIACFGGGAGGGKTYSMLLEALWHHDKPGFTCAFFRKNAIQLRSPGGLWSASQEMFRDFGGTPKETTLEWNFPSGSTYKFAHLAHESDVYGWQGSQITLCVAKGTKVLMADQSYKNIEDIEISEYVQTLKGPKKVTSRFPSQIKECVKVKVFDSKGELTQEQIHPTDHKFLTLFGWLSSDDLKRLSYQDFYAKLHSDLCKSPESILHKSHNLLPFEPCQFLKEHDVKQEQSFSGNSFCEVWNAYLTNDQTYISKYEGEHQESRQPLGCFVPLMLPQPFPQSGSCEASSLNENIEDEIKFPLRSLDALLPSLYHSRVTQALHKLLEHLKFLPSHNNLHNPFEQEIELLLTFDKFLISRISQDDQLLLLSESYDNFYPLLHAISHAQALLKQADLRVHCSICSDQYDVQLHLLLNNVRSYLQPLNDVVERFSLFLYNSDATDKFQLCNRSYHIEYAHPYSYESREADLCCQIGSCTITPCGNFDVYDLTVEGENHYITISGLINQNCIFDELTHFSREQFFYMLSRNRSTCGVKPYVRATCNPDADSWVRTLVDWYVDNDTGLAIPERSGVLRWFIMINDQMIWADSKEELQSIYPDCLPKSFTFISASIYDNKKLLEADPGYLANLHALSRVERERLLNGNWNIKASAGLYFQKGYFEIVDAVPANRNAVRYWDRAATRKTDTNDPDYTVGIRIEKDSNNILYVTDMVRIQESPLGVQNIIKNTAIRDGISVRIGIEEDPGQAGVADAEHLTRLLQGFNVKRNRVMKDKVTRALPVSAQAEVGNIKIVRAKWNDDFFRELENFPEGNHDDIVDSLSGAFLMINQASYNLSSLAR